MSDEKIYKCDTCGKRLSEEEALVCTDCGDAFCQDCEQGECPNDPRGHTTQ